MESPPIRENISRICLVVRKGLLKADLETVATLAARFTLEFSHLVRFEVTLVTWEMLTRGRLGFALELAHSEQRQRALAGTTGAAKHPTSCLPLPLSPEPREAFTSLAVVTACTFHTPSRSGGRTSSFVENR